MTATKLEMINDAAREAVAARYKSLPPLPTAKELSAQLRQLNEAYSHPDCGGCEASLYCEGAGWPDAHWRVDSMNDGATADRWPGSPHQEYVPGDTKRGRFDSAAAARRLLSEARLAGFK